MKEIYEVRYCHQETGNYKRLNAYNNINDALLQMRQLNAKHGDGEPFYVHKIVIE